ncbi:MAG: hypothetical protein ACK56I_20880, partial [bacterium]
LLPEEHRANTFSTADSLRDSGGGLRLVGGSSDGQDEQSQIVVPPETGEKPSLLSVLSDAPWLNRRHPGSLSSIIEYE